MYFTYKNTGYIYIEQYNNIFQVTNEKARSILEKKDSLTTETLIREEFGEIGNNEGQHNKFLLHEEYYLKNITSQDIYDFEFSFESSTQKDHFVVFNLSNQKELIKDVISFQEENKDKKVKILIRENIENLFDESTISILLERKIDFQYYSNFESLEKFISSGFKERTFVELKIKSSEEFDKFLNLSIPKNIVISFHFENVDVALKGVELVKNKIENYFSESNVNISNYFDIVRILKFNFGRYYNREYIYKNNEFKLHDIGNCNTCWAKKICHQTRLFNFFDESPILTQTDNKKCDLLRDFAENFLKLLLLFKEVQNIKMNAILIEKEGYKIKLVNP